ncbi:alginate export family protein [Candidatus Colwellia aromaticivorans]|uniref:alginate export family protein n=1 Tax=Candidatus Colwellia aromaticivorans TaxID=2267621 RepID=UPI000DF1E23C|nr:alginate export family protein [Candidatus Colwellia aromaticivorans]
MNTKNINVKTFTLSLLTAAILSAPAAFAADPAHGKGITDALADSKVNLSFRARYEGVDEDNARDNANALTVKSRLTIKTGNYNNLSLGLEVDHVSALADNYWDKVGADNNYSVVADPTGTDVNQGYIKYTRNDFSAIAGRQRILHNNQRFVGGVGWRQNEQTYDGIRAQYNTGAFSVDYSYIHNINDIFAKNVSGDFHLANLGYKINKAHKVAAFAYILDFKTGAANSSSTYGALYNGKFGPVLVNASAASQSDNGKNPNSYTATYLNAEVGYKFSTVTVLGGYELLGSDNNVGFNTPLATKHKFQGWADKFLGTPKEGMEDIYLTVKGAVSGVKLAATYHDFSSDVGGIDFGNELDLVANYKVNKNYGVLVKFSNYSQGDVYGKLTDTNKLWLQATAKF